MSIHLINFIEKSQKRSDPNFINKIKQKFELGKELDFQEMELWAENIQSRLKLKSEVSIQEEAFYILQDQSNIEKFLYDSNNERFSQILD